MRIVLGSRAALGYQRVWGSLAMLLAVGYANLSVEGTVSAQQQPWTRHAVDSELRGADGVKLADVNQDGHVDLVSGWEESGAVRVYLHPGIAKVIEAWPVVDIGRAPSVEDAVWYDLNSDGRLDVLSCSEGKEQVLRAHFAPKQKEALLDAAAWRSQVVSSSKQMTRWMFAVPLEDRRLGSSLPTGPRRIVVASKNPNGLVGLLDCEAADPSQWRIEPLAKAAWIMSVFCMDIDGDTDVDVVYSDRKSDQSGVYWLENPGQSSASWEKHLIGGAGEEVMFMAVTLERTKGGGGLCLFAPSKPSDVLEFTSPSKQEYLRQPWPVTRHTLSMTDRIGNLKAVAAGDIDDDGSLELVLSCESANPPRSGVFYLKRHKDQWQMRDVSGPEGIKFDLLELVDLDEDGDLDILTCEERHAGRGLGVIWYANPLRP